MKRVLLLVLIIVAMLVFCGCPNTITQSTDITNADVSDESSSVNQNSSSSNESVNEAINPDGISEKEFNGIDWNTDAYSKYYMVVADQAIIHYWDGGATALMIVPDTLMYVSGGESLVLDLKTGNTSEGYGAAFIPQSASPPSEDKAPHYSDFAGVEVFDDEDIYVFRYDVDEGEASYFVNRSLVCVGWTYESYEGSVTYILNDNLTFEQVVDDIFREYADGTTSGDNSKYADADGDGYSDWNEDRKPSNEEFDYLTDLWKSEGLTGFNYFAKIDELMGDMVDIEDSP